MVGLSRPDSRCREYERVDSLQTIGNRLREVGSFVFLAEKVVEEIATNRVDDGWEDEGLGAAKKPIALRKAHIIDSLKNPAEVKLLRQVYGDVFWLIGVFAPEGVRQARLKSKNVDDSTEAAKMMKRDKEERDLFGQQVAKTMYEADFFVRNDKPNIKQLTETVSRFLEILFGISVCTPTLHESAMYAAVSASSRSACLSRQVGAAIYSKTGEELGVGCNDVPRFGGSLYKSEDAGEDHRCFLWGGRICHNDHEKDQIYKDVAKVLFGPGGIQDALSSAFAESRVIDKADKQEVERILTDQAIRRKTEMLLAKTEIRNLIEFSRSVHAEMEAIISAARSQKAGLVGSTIYTTVFPCHNCARHIVAAGIHEVIYIEPYPKSKAVDLHNDAVSMDDKERGKKVIFLQYEGIAPKNFVRLFRHGAERKIDGHVVIRDKKTARPVFPPPLDGFATREALVMTTLDKREKAIKASYAMLQPGMRHDREESRRE